MKDRFHNRIEPLFSMALQEPLPGRRAVYLDASCAGDAAVRSRIEALLTAHERAGDFLQTPIVELDECGFVLWDEFSQHPEQASRHESDALSFLDPPEEPGELGRFSGYVVTELLGRGGAGIVVKGLDRRLNRVVALKVLAPEWASQPRARQRFLREARAAAAVRHPHVVAIHAIDESAALPFLVMEHIAGSSLQERLRGDAPLKLREILRIGQQTASGLAAVHAQRLVHRDVKPANVLLEDGTGDVKLTDFGLARTVDDVGLTQEGIIAGTPQYMSPEQAKGEAVDFRSDLFSLGALLYALCAGEPPFQADSTLAVMRKICEEQPRPVAELRPDVLPELARLISELLEKNAERRPPTADEVAGRLGRLLDDLESGIDPGSFAAAGGSARLGPLTDRRGVLAACALGATAVAAAAIGFYRWGKHNPAPNKQPQQTLPERFSPQKRAANPDSSENKTASKGVTGGRAASATRPLFDETVKPLSEFRRMTVPGRVDSLAVSLDGERIYAGCSNGIIYGWSARTGQEALRVAGHKPVTMRLLVPPDGTRLISLGADRRLRVTNTQSGAEVLQVWMSIPFRGAAISPDGTELAVSFVGGAAGARIARMSKVPDVRTRTAGPPPIHDRLSVFSVATGRRLRLMSAPGTDSYFEVDWSADGKWIAAGTDAGRVVLFDARSGAMRREFTASSVPGPAYGVRFSGDSRRLYAAGSGNMVWGWELPGGKPTVRRRFNHGVVRFDVSSDDRWLAIGGRPEVRLWALHDSAGHDVLLKLEGHKSAVRNVAFVPGADVLVSSGPGGTVRLWRLPPK